MLRKLAIAGALAGTLAVASSNPAQAWPHRYWHHGYWGGGYFHAGYWAPAPAWGGGVYVGPAYHYHFWVDRWGHRHYR